MKNLLNRTSSLLMLLVLSSLIALFAFSLKQGLFLQSIAGQTQPSGYPGPKSISDSSLQEPYPGPPTVENGTAVVEVPSNQTPKILPTKIPIIEGAYRASETEELSVGRKLNVEQIFNYAIYGDTLVARVHLADGGTALVEMNLDVGSSNVLLEVPEKDFAGFNDLQLSERYVAWLDSEPKGNQQLLQILDLVKGELFTLQRGNIREIDLRDSTIAWGETLKSGITVHDLATQKDFFIASDSVDARFAKVCSSDWIAYLHNFAEQERFIFTTSADLTVHHIPTGQELLIGRLYNVSTIPGDRITNFDCDNLHLVWVTLSEKESLQPELHVFDFTTEQDQLIDELQGELKPFDNYVLLDGDIIISRVGYDLAQDVPFTPFLDRSRSEIFGPLPILSG